MKDLLILGAGSAGTMMANHLVKKLDKHSWRITIVDQEKVHYYQPGFLFLPFGINTEAQIIRPLGQFIPKGVTLVNEPIDRIVGEENKVILQNGETLHYDIVIVATGCRIAPDEVEGMHGDEWHKSIHDFYTFEGAKALTEKLANWEGGRLLMHVSEMPIKCPVAPLEFCFLADDYFQKRGIRDKVDITYVTPLGGAFTKPTAARKLGHMLEEKGVSVVPDFYIERVDTDRQVIVDYGEQEVPYDLLVTVPPNMGDPCIERSGLGDDLNFIPTDKHTLQAKAFDNMFVVGDATNLPTSKAGSVAHFEADVLAENIIRYINGQELEPAFDGHANCFIETGKGKGLLIDFNYEQEPVEGTFPIAGIGPLQLLRETRLNHWGKLAFRWIYWNMLLKARPLPMISTPMQLAGKRIKPAEAPQPEEEPVG
ncbi:MAG: NAD(P)/FAD-dependent oxidoreductase [Lewinella sp.]|nr:NAD(P)/FAD-dependent oxidoreductase [Lewinella sp.]